VHAGTGAEHCRPFLVDGLGTEEPRCHHAEPHRWEGPGRRDAVLCSVDEVLKLTEYAVSQSSVDFSKFRQRFCANSETYVALIGREFLVCSFKIPYETLAQRLRASLGWLGGSVAPEVKGSTLIVAALQLLSEAWPVEQLTTVIAVT